MCASRQPGPGHQSHGIGRGVITGPPELALGDARRRSYEPLWLPRRGFLRAAFALALSPLLRYVPAHAATPLDIAEIAPGVFVHQGRYEMQSPDNRGDMANASFVVGRDAVAVIDTLGSAVVGRELRDCIRAVTDKPIRYVINTHMHPDHVFGNAAFKEDNPVFVASHKLARGLSSRAEHYLAVNKQMLGPDAFEGIEVILPTLAVDGTLSLDLGGRTLICQTEPTAHTDNDLTVTDTLTDTLFLGDLLFSVHVPTLDGSIRGWLALIDDFEKRKAARVVPGHGPHAMQLPDALEPEKRYLTAIVTDIRELIKQDKTLEDATKSAGAEERDNWKLFQDYHIRNVTAAFAELEWE
jgi:quinoprotein relay system zinc metallohydrolase 2